MKDMLKSKKGQVMSQLGALGVGIATLAIILTVTFLIIAQAQTQIIEIESLVSIANVGSIGLNATKTLAGAIDDIPGWVPLIIITAIGAILLGLVTLFRRKG